MNKVNKGPWLLYHLTVMDLIVKHVDLNGYARWKVFDFYLSVIGSERPERGREVCTCIKDGYIVPDFWIFRILTDLRLLSAKTKKEDKFSFINKDNDFYNFIKENVKKHTDKIEKKIDNTTWNCHITQFVKYSLHLL